MLLLSGVPEGRIFGLDQQTFIQVLAMFVNIGILAVVLSHFLYNPVRKFMRSRADGIQAQMDSAKADMAEALELKKQYEEKLSEAESERDEILDSARKLAEEKTKRIIEEARNEAEAIKQRAANDIVIEQKRVREEMIVSIIDVSSVMAGKFIDHAIDKKTQDKLIAEAMAELNDLSWTESGL